MTNGPFSGKGTTAGAGEVKEGILVIGREIRT